jgi:hypothetical protein
MNKVIKLDAQAFSHAALHKSCVNGIQLIAQKILGELVAPALFKQRDYQIIMPFRSLIHAAATNAIEWFNLDREAIINMRAMTSTNGSDSSAVVTSPVIQEVPVTVDSKGRVRASKEQRRVILAEFERSRMSAAQFAKRAGLKYSTLAGWLQRYRRAKSKGRSEPVRLLERD